MNRLQYLGNQLGRARSWLAAAGAGLALSWLAFGAPRAAAPREGAPAPAFRLADVSGQAASLAQYHGTVVLLDFWATWCDSCMEELPDLKRLDAKFAGRGFALLAPSVDNEGRRALIPFIAKNGIPWRVLLADDAVVRAYKVFGLPTKYLIDQSGVIRRKFVGPPEPSELERAIETVLNRRTS